MVESNGFDQIMSVMDDPEQHAKWQEITKWQTIDVNEVKSSIIDKKKEKDKINLLWARYPSLHIYVLRALNRHSEVQKYMKECKEDGSYYDEYSFYVHAYLIPFLDQKRAAGELKQGRIFLVA